MHPDALQARCAPHLALVAWTILALAAYMMPARADDCNPQVFPRIPLEACTNPTQLLPSADGSYVIVVCPLQGLWAYVNGTFAKQLTEESCVTPSPKYGSLVSLHMNRLVVSCDSVQQVAVSGSTVTRVMQFDIEPTFTVPPNVTERLNRTQCGDEVLFITQSPISAKIFVICYSPAGDFLLVLDPDPLAAPNSGVLGMLPFHAGGEESDCLYPRTLAVSQSGGATERLFVSCYSKVLELHPNQPATTLYQYNGHGPAGVLQVVGSFLIIMPVRKPQDAWEAEMIVYDLQSNERSFYNVSCPRVVSLVIAPSSAPIQLWAVCSTGVVAISGFEQGAVEYHVELPQFLAPSPSSYVQTADGRKFVAGSASGFAQVNPCPMRSYTILNGEPVDLTYSLEKRALFMSSGAIPLQLRGGDKSLCASVTGMHVPVKPEHQFMSTAGDFVHIVADSMVVRYSASDCGQPATILLTYPQSVGARGCATSPNGTVLVGFANRADGISVVAVVGGSNSSVKPIFNISQCDPAEFSYDAVAEEFIVSCKNRWVFFLSANGDTKASVLRPEQLCSAPIATLPLVWASGWYLVTCFDELRLVSRALAASVELDPFIPIKDTALVGGYRRPVFSSDGRTAYVPCVGVVAISFDLPAGLSPHPSSVSYTVITAISSLNVALVFRLAVSEKDSIFIPSYTDWQIFELDPFCSGVGGYTLRASGCLPCHAGTFRSENSLSVTCSQCPKGRFSSALAASCTACTPGWFSDVRGSVTCFPCSAGRFSSTNGSSACSACASGWFQSATNATSCEPCRAGSFSASDGSNTCDPCSEGKFSNTSHASQCTVCEIGRHAPNRNQTECAFCPVGTYMDQPGASFCVPCPVGRYQSWTGATSCKTCELGTGNVAAQQSSCSKCRNATFASNSSNGQCQRCFGFVVNDSTDCLTRYCPRGFFVDQSAEYEVACVPCPAGTYNSVDNSSASFCTPASSNSYVPKSGSSSPLPCIVPGTRCDNGSIYPLKGYWMFVIDNNTGEVDTMPCLPGYCAGRSNSSSAQCAPGRLQSDTNYLCGLCEEGLYDWRGRCVSCSNSYIAFFFLAVVVSFALVSLLHLFVVSNSSRRGSTVRAYVPVLTYYFQVMTIMVGPSEVAFGWLRFFNFQVSELPFASCFAPLHSWAKWDFTFALLFFPFFELILLVVLTMRSKGGSTWRKFVRTLVLLAVVLYTEICTTIFRFFVCTSVADARVVYFFPDLHCSGSEWSGRVAVLCALVLAYPIGFPLGICSFLGRRQARVSDPAAYAFFDALTSAFRSGVRWWYASFVLVRRLMFALLDTVLVRGVVVHNGAWKYATFSLLHLLWILVHVVSRPYDLSGDSDDPDLDNRTTFALQAMGATHASKDEASLSIADSESSHIGAGMDRNRLFSTESLASNSQAPSTTSAAAESTNASKDRLHWTELILLTIICASAALFCASPPPFDDALGLRILVIILVTIPGALAAIAALWYGKSRLVNLYRDLQRAPSSRSETDQGLAERLLAPTAQAEAGAW